MTRYSDKNMVVLSGRLTDDGKLNKTQAGSFFLTFAVACNKYYEKNGEEVQQTSFIDIVRWGPNAEGDAGNAQKGRPVTVVGELSTSSFINDEGANIKRIQVKADSIAFR
jgi:single-strand DNA-binding protein